MSKVASISSRPVVEIQKIALSPSDDERTHCWVPVSLSTGRVLEFKGQEPNYSVESAKRVAAKILQLAQPLIRFHIRG